MPMHDWNRVPAAIFHAFHHAWISAISDALNGGLLPNQFYGLVQRPIEGRGLDRFDLNADPSDERPWISVRDARLFAGTDAEFLQRRKPSITVRRSHGDGIVAMINIVSPGNKSSRRSFKAFVQKRLICSSRESIS